MAQLEKIMSIYYGTDKLPYKDEDRQTHYPIAGETNTFVGENNTTKVRFFVDRIGGSNYTWVAKVKKPNGTICYRVLEMDNDDYVDVDLSFLYTDQVGQIDLALNGYTAQDITITEDDGVYEISGNPTVICTGIVKIIINYAPLILNMGASVQPTEYQQILALLSTKISYGIESEKVNELPTTGKANTIYYVKSNYSDIVYDIYYWNGTTFAYLGTTAYSLYTKEDGIAFENALRSYVNTQLGYLEQEIQQVASGSPKGVYATLSDLQTAYPAGTSGIYVVSANGHWYYWNGSAWTDGGQYLMLGLEAENIDFDNANNEFTSTNVQDAVQEARNDIIEKRKIVHNYGDIDLTSSSATQTFEIATQFNIEPNTDYTFEYDSIVNNDSILYATIFVEMYDSSWGNRIRIDNTLSRNLNNVLATFKTGATSAFIASTKLIVVGKTASGGNIKIYGLKLVKGKSDNIKQINSNVALAKKSVDFCETAFIDDNRIFNLGAFSGNDRQTFALLLNNEQLGNALTFSVGKIGTNNALSSVAINILFYDSSNNLLYSSNLNINRTKIQVETPNNTSRVVLQIEPTWDNSDDNRGYYIEDFAFYKGVIGEVVLDERIKQNYVDYKKFNLPILYLVGDTSSMTKETSVDLNYEYKGATGTANVKWQGTSSLAYPKKNYTIKFDNKFEAKEGWGEQKKYCLKANWIDFSHARNIVGAKTWGTIVKSDNSPQYLERVKDLVNGGAVDGFPIVLVINEVFEGIYTFNIPKDKWMFGMTGENEHEAIICAEGGTGCLFTTNPVLGVDFEVEYATDEEDTSWIQTALTNIYNAVANLTQDNIEETLGQYVDIPSFIDYMLYVATMGAGDNVSKNYILYTYDGTKWYFSSYDMDGTFGLAWDGKSYNKFSYTPPFDRGDNSIYAKMQRFAKTQLKNRWQYLYANELSADNIVNSFYNFITLFPIPLLQEDAKKWKLIPSTLTNNVAQIGIYTIKHLEYLNSYINNLQ